MNSLSIILAAKRGEGGSVEGGQHKPCFVYMLFKEDFHRPGMIDLGHKVGASTKRMWVPRAAEGRQELWEGRHHYGECYILPHA